MMPTGTRRSECAALFLAAVGLGLCGGQALSSGGPPPAGAVEDTEAAIIDRLVKVARDGKKDLQDRRKAVDELGKRRARAAVPELHKLLPGEYDVLTLGVVAALGEIRDPRSSLTLKKMLADAEAAGIEIPGKINTVIHRAISRCTPAKDRK
jgi:hypothetical protein